MKKKLIVYVVFSLFGISVFSQEKPPRPQVEKVGVDCKNLERKECTNEENRKQCYWSRAKKQCKPIKK